MKKEASSPSHKLFTILGTVLCIILVPILLVNVILIIKSYTDTDKVPSIGGFLPLIVLTDSMYPEIKSGDLIICRTADACEIVEGDVISFFDPAGNGTSIVTHRVTEVLEENGLRYFRTKGDNNNVEDRLVVPEGNLVGVYRARIGGAGNVAMFMQTTTGLIVCVVLPIILLVAYDVIRRRVYDRKKQFDNEALLQELQALREAAAQRENASESTNADEN